MLSGKQDGEGTEMLLHARELRVTQSLVDDVIYGACEGTGDVSPREKGRYYMGHFQIPKRQPS